jgi:hypothetical protein
VGLRDVRRGLEVDRVVPQLEEPRDFGLPSLRAPTEVKRDLERLDDSAGALDIGAEPRSHLMLEHGVDFVVESVDSECRGGNRESPTTTRNRTEGEGFEPSRGLHP